MKNLYLELREKQKIEFDKFPSFFAFNNDQFKEGMEKLGLTANDRDQVDMVLGGMYCKKSDGDKLQELFDKRELERQEAIKEDTDGNNYIYHMFRYELSNHEYGYTMEIDDTLEALGLTIEDINNNENLKNGLDKATKEYDNY